MKLLLLGATGGTGRQLLTQALAAGHDVTAFARRGDGIPTRHERLRVVEGDILDGSARIKDAVAGQDAVISALGRGKTFRSDHLIERCVPVILAAMRVHGVQRLIFTSAIGAGETINDAPLFSRLFIRILLGDIYADKIAGEAHIRRSDIDWTLVQPSQLTDGPLTRRYRAGEHLPMSGIPTISRADAAHFMLDQVHNPAYVRRVVLLTY